ncbi:DoxX family protein [Corynebacterium minutissimum]|uniref:DoxX family protein n=1 Tax=Corynebacterium minutissimum TaxID=38301 RepID=UPI001EF3BE4B|nr:DoxX family protein [Corynebacterium minutissimum]MCG7228995.1 DoxX family membrane protein [Corynebacterium minutissimum]MCG7238112.1 DoxX family membrane protein [Corynebacterium minutissimum]
MSDKTPDKATDIDDDIPTYNSGANSVKAGKLDKAETTTDAVTDKASGSASAEEPKKSRLFQRAGRAEPTVIKPKPAEAATTDSAPTSDPAAEAKTESFESASRDTRDSLSFDSSAADTETTAFPRAEATAEPSAETYDDVPSTVAVADPAIESDSETRVTEEEPQRARRGTIDFGLLFVRLALSIYLLVAGASTFFKLGGNEGLSGLENEYGEYTMAAALAIGVPTVQLIAGAFLLLGLVTPLAAMFGLIVTGFEAIHGLNASGDGLDVFAWNESVWLGLVLFAIAVALQFTGPGFISLDFNRSWTRRPLATSWIFVVIGVAALVAIWWFGTGVNPLS